MHEVALIGIVDERGWLLMQERDDQTPVDPDRWGLVGGGIEAGETPAEAAARELAEETGLGDVSLLHLGDYVLPCDIAGEEDQVSLFTAATMLSDEDIVCGEGRQIVFVDPTTIGDLDLSHLARALVPVVLKTHVRGADKS